MTTLIELITHNPNPNRIMPKGSQFCAMVDGKPTGLAGCVRTDECQRAVHCLRASDALEYRADLCAGTAADACTMFIAAQRFVPRSEAIQ